MSSRKVILEALRKHGIDYVLDYAYVVARQAQCTEQYVKQIARGVITGKIKV